uniref:Putative HD domain-containing protein n=1 Tax=viral metagenome TaxID=1070528 RepID=A0A6H1ZWY2_9ZZZZ
MKQGTVSVIFGCHSVGHSLLVLVAWRRLYRQWPAWWQVVCILLHDIGHWGKDYLDDYEQKKKHSVLGAKVAKVMCGQKGYDLVAGHNLYNGAPKSLLHDPDKYSWVIAPVWWIVTNNYFEPKLVVKGSSRKESAIMFKAAMKANMDEGFKDLGQEIYFKLHGIGGENG